jgi:putative ABC transport system substrate-binding protein
MYFTRECPAAGGLINCGGDLTDTHGQAGIYTGRFLKGEKLADLPVQQLIKVELIISQDSQGARPLRASFATRPSDEVIE